MPRRRVLAGIEFHRERARRFGVNMAKKKEKMGPWVDLPQRDFMNWVSDWIVSSMVLKAYTQNKGKKMPKKLRLPKECMEENKDGSATLHFEVSF